MLTAAFVFMFVAGGVAGYVIKTILMHRYITLGMRWNVVADRRQCMVAGCTIPGKHSHLH
jgi:hypothetical protein